MIKIRIRRVFSFILVLIMLLTSNLSAFSMGIRVSSIDYYDDIRVKDLSRLDLRDEYDKLITLEFDDYTKWPEKHKMPEKFSPEKVIEWGKNPGLNVRKLHSMGYTGKGVNIAYIDQPLHFSHPAYENVNLKYYYSIMDKYGEISKSSMHGPAVLSLLAGKEIGTAPDANVYFVANPAWLANQKSHADSIRVIIEENKNLPQEEKIKIIAFSDNVDDSEKFSEEFRKAIDEAKVNDILIFLCGEPMDIHRIISEHFTDRDDYRSYMSIGWHGELNKNPSEDGIYVPVNRTTAVQNWRKNDAYGYFHVGGASWTTPYILGVMAMGLQIAPDLTTDELMDYLMKSAYPYGMVKEGGIINPEGFIKLIESEKGRNYKFFVYNSNKLNSEDIAAIRNYRNQFDKSEDIYYVDVKGMDEEEEIYKYLKEKHEDIKGRLTGIQIFGISEDVSAFKVNFKIQMSKGIDDGGKFLSDYFYCNFDNDMDELKDFSIYKTFKEKLNINFIPRWKVVRLPLKRGEFKNYIDKYIEYTELVKEQKQLPLVNFSNPIFQNNRHNDDMGYFISERMNKEFGVIKESRYRLYGNLCGVHPVNTKVIGDINQGNLRVENKKEIIDLLINSHGQSDNIDRAIFIEDKDVSKYEKLARHIIRDDDGYAQVRIALLNSESINEVLCDNYYNLMLWTCNNAYGLNDNNISYEALADGKAINIFAASTVLSNNGVNNRASLDEMKKNNFYYFYYNFMKYYYGGYSRSDSFYNAKREYVKEILNNTDLLGGANYQFNLHNALIYHHLGLIEFNPLTNKRIIKVKPHAEEVGAVQKAEEKVKRSREPYNEVELPYIKSTQKNFISYVDDGMEYIGLSYNFDQTDDRYKVHSIEAAQDEKNIYLKIKYHIPFKVKHCIFLEGDAPGLKEFTRLQEKGDRLMILKFSKEQWKSFESGLVINLGKRNFVFIDLSI